MHPVPDPFVPLFETTPQLICLTAFNQANFKFHPQFSGAKLSVIAPSANLF